MLHPFYFTKCLSSQKLSNIASSHITKKIDLQKVSELVVSFYFTPMYLLYSRCEGFLLHLYDVRVHHLDAGILALPLFRFPLFFFFLFVVLFCDVKLNLKSAKINKTFIKSISKKKQSNNTDEIHINSFLWWRLHF